MLYAELAEAFLHDEVDGVAGHAVALSATTSRVTDTSAPAAAKGITATLMTSRILSAETPLTRTVSFVGSLELGVCSVASGGGWCPGCQTRCRWASASWVDD